MRQFARLLTRLALVGAAVTAPAVASAQEALAPYEGFKVVEVDVLLPRHLVQLEELGESMSCRPSLGLQRYAMHADRLPELDLSGLAYRVVVDDLQKVIDDETATRQAARVQGGTFFSDYRTYDEINAQLTLLENQRPDLVEQFVIGFSLEGRPTYGIRIGNLDPDDPAGDEASKPGIVINGCQHAREWISPASVTYVATELVQQYGIDARITDLVDNVVFYIVPVVNPDGYVYTFPTSQGGQGVRLWRKNRRNNGGGSFGVDLNRNWSVDWGGPGADSFPTSDIYRGTGPFSEPETVNLSTFMSSLPNVKAHLDIHSFSQLILGPWAYSETECPPREEELRTAQDAMEEAMDAAGVNYTAGLGCDALLYVASGTAPDWSFETLDALAWTYELRDTGANGFVLPPSQIIPTGIETLAGIMTLAEYIQITLAISAEAPSLLPIDTPTSFPVQIVGFNGAQLFNAALKYRVNGGALQSQSLPGAGPSFNATLPGAACGDVLTFFIEATTSDGSVVLLPEEGDLAPFSAIVADLQIAVQDAMESDPGWTVGAAGDDATTGIWQRGNPEGTAAQPEDDHSPIGTDCWVTGLAANGGNGGNDVDNGQTTLTSPTYDLAGADGASISYWRWFSNDAGASPNQDVFTVEISNNGGISWTTVEVVGPTGPETGGGWFRHEFAVNDFVSPTAQVQLRFIADDSGPGSVVEAAIDDLEVQTSAPCPPDECEGDATGDGVVDLNDLNLVLANFSSSTSDGDVNGDGIVDLNDLNIVLANFNASC